MREGTRLYVEGLTPYRRIASMLSQRVGHPISARAINTWVEAMGAAARSPLEMSARLRPTWGGALGVDGKTVRIDGAPWIWLVAVDQQTQDIVHARTVPSESSSAFEVLVRECVTGADYPLNGLITDGWPPFVSAWQDHFAKIPLQICRVHLDRRTHRFRPRTGEAGARAIELCERVRAVIYAATYDLHLRRLYALTGDWHRYDGLMPVGTDPIQTLQRLHGLHSAHLRHPGLPADANITENVIRQLNKKIAPMEGFSSLASADRYLGLLVGCYRAKRFTDSRAPRRNGLAPLELAGIDLAGRDWLDLLLEP